MFNKSKLIMLPIVILIGLTSYYLLPEGKKIIATLIVAFVWIVYYAWLAHYKKQ